MSSPPEITTTKLRLLQLFCSLVTVLLLTLPCYVLLHSVTPCYGQLSLLQMLMLLQLFRQLWLLRQLQMLQQGQISLS